MYRSLTSILPLYQTARSTLHKLVDLSRAAVVYSHVQSQLLHAKYEESATNAYLHTQHMVCFTQHVCQDVTRHVQLQNAARDGFLDEVIFRRANISLAMFAGTNLFFLASTFVPNPIYPSSPLLPTSALALGAINVNQLWVSGINFVKYSPEGFNTFKIFKVSRKSDSSLTLSVWGLWSSGLNQCITLT